VKLLQQIEQIRLNDRQCFTIGETDEYFVEIVPMIFSDRLVMTPKEAPMVYDYGWCYDKGGAALFAAMAWDPDKEAEPPGYNKRATPNVRTLT
jgi:hypothetical protein